MITRVTGRKCTVYLFVSILLFISTWLFVQQGRYLKFKTTPARIGASTKHRNIYKTFLLWNEFGNKTWYLPADTVTLLCPRTTCVVTNQRDYLPYVEMFDAVLFHAVRNLADVPQTRTLQQLYVFVLLESPAYTLHDLSQEEGFYNLTMTYRLDSDVIWSYAKIIDKQTKTIVAPVLNPTWRKTDTEWTQFDVNLKAIIKGKTKLAAWFTSHCKTASKREQIAQELQEYVPIDIYGKCGSLTCSREVDASCQEMLDRDYKFYLSFENSLCTDYVTEKFFNALQRHVVPVVFGGADYANIAPPHSYIDAKSFKSVADLAAYLLHLDSSVEEYGRYFWWKRYYEVEPPNQFCDLCDQINSLPLQHQMQSYTNIKGFWQEDRNGYDVCFEKEEYFSREKFEQV